MDTDVFVGRTDYISRAESTFSSHVTATGQSTTTFLLLRGPGGIGKTKLASRLRVLAQDMGYTCSQITDLRATSNRAQLSLLASIARTLPRDSFEPFWSALSRYYAAEDIERKREYSDSVNSFITCCRLFSAESPILLVLDTFEAIHRWKLEKWLLQILQQLGGRCIVLIASRLPVAIEEGKVEDLEVMPFSELETVELAKSLYERRETEFDLDEHTLTEIHSRARGVPILVTLAIEWILENAHPEEIIAVPHEEFEFRMVERIRMLQEPESFAILMMAVADRRFNPAILALLSGASEVDCAKICAQLARFSFVKLRPDDYVLTLHDEMLRLIGQYIDLPEPFKNERREVLISTYYDPVILALNDPQQRQNFTAEKLHYQLSCKTDEAIACFDTEMQLAIESYEFDYCQLLLEEVNRHRLTAMQLRYVQLCQAELALKQYRPAEARPFLDQLAGLFDAELEAEGYCRVLEGLGESIINPCTLMRADPFEAIKYWRESLDICSRKQLRHRIPTILFSLGSTYGATGQYDKAEHAFVESFDLASKAGENRLAARSLDELNRICRLQQDVNKALTYIERSLDMKQTSNDVVGMGITYYYLGCTQRDLGHFDQAAHYYVLAMSALGEIDDTFNLCRLYSDISWTAFLQDDYDRAEQYVAMSRNLSVDGQFGTEISESWHIEYEMTIARGNSEDAYKCLDEALHYARTYGNIYMILDCLHHDAQRALAQRDYAKIPKILQEMRNLEDRGCGIRVFRGRAIIVLGDAEYSLGRLEHALSYWKEGLTIVARYGNSRTNVELFEDILNRRRQNLEDVLYKLGPVAALELKAHWLRHGLESEFSTVIHVCNESIAIRRAHVPSVKPGTPLLWFLERRKVKP